MNVQLLERRGLILLWLSWQSTGLQSQVQYWQEFGSLVQHAICFPVNLQCRFLPSAKLNQVQIP